MVDEINGTGIAGWVTTAGLVAIAIVKGIWDYLKKKSDNETKLKLSETDSDKISKLELSKQYNELLAKFSELELKFEATERQLDRALNTFDIIFPLIENLLADKPEYRVAFENALKILKNN